MPNKEAPGDTGRAVHLASGNSKDKSRQPVLQASSPINAHALHVVPESVVVSPCFHMLFKTVDACNPMPVVTAVPNGNYSANTDA